MATLITTPPPDGFYWYRAEQAGSKLTIVQVWRPSAEAINVAMVQFLGREGHEFFEDCPGIFLPIETPILFG